MRNFSILLIIILCTSCISNKFCNSKTTYFKFNIDKSKDYSIIGNYCISNIKDTILEGSNTFVSFKVFDRIKGKSIEDGVVWFYGSDTTKMIYNNNLNSKQLPCGKYIIEAWDVGFTGQKTKRINLKKNTKTEIIFFLGTTVVH